MYTNKGVLKTERCMIDNQWRLFLTGVICEHLVVLTIILARLFLIHGEPAKVNSRKTSEQVITEVQSTFNQGVWGQKSSFSHSIPSELL